MHTFPVPKLKNLEAYPFSDFVEYVVSTHPRFASLSGIVRAGRLINGARSEDGVVRWADDDAKVMQEICSEEDDTKALKPPTQLTVTKVTTDGTQSTQEITVPGFFFAPFVTEILESIPESSTK